MSFIEKNNAAVELVNVSVVLERKKILKNVSLKLEKGKIIGLLGPSGAGKTTLIRTIIGRQAISHGRARVLSAPAGSAAVRPWIGYMTQTAAVYLDLSVRQNLSYFAAMRGADKREVKTLLEQVNLSSQANQLAETLSGGQCSRLSLAIALLGNPPLICLDEPTVGVDPVLRQQLWQLFKTLAKKGTTLIVTSHAMDEAAQCDQLVLIRNGSVLAHGTPKSLLSKTRTKTIENSFIKLVGKGSKS